MRNIKAEKDSNRKNTLIYNDGVDFKVCLPHEAEIYESIFDTLLINSSVLQSAQSLQ